LLISLQLGDGTFPSGRYTLSHGLETFVQEKRLTSREDLRELLEDYVTLSVGPTDGVATAASVRALAAGDLDRLVDIDRLLLSLKLARESAASSMRTGNGLLNLAVDLSDHIVLSRYRALVQSKQAPGNYAVAFGLLAGALGSTASEAVVVELYSCVASLLGVAMRIFPIDHTFAQQTLRDLRPVLGAVAEQAAALDYREMGAFAPSIDVMQMRHELASVRLFGS
jgi:urease accessory protein